MTTRVTRRRLTAAALGVATVAAVAAVGTGALFTDSASVTGNLITTGTVDISTDQTSAAITASAMMPGDTVYAPIKVNNLGTAQLRYAVTSTTTEDVLASALQVAVSVNPTTCDSTGFASGTALTLQGTAFGATTGEKMIGDPTAGAQTGDRVLAGSANETLCFKVSLPSSNTTASGLSTTASLAFAAEQTANN